MSSFGCWQSGSAALMALGTVAGAAAPLVISAPAAAQANFSDVGFSFWARPFIQPLAQNNIIAGFPGGQYRPNDPVTRAQFAAIVTKAFSKNPTRALRTFSDVPANYWAAGAIQEAYSTGFMSGYPDGSFRPDEQIPRAQVLIALASGLGYKHSGSTSTTLSVYSDGGDIPTYAREGITAATQKKMVVDYPDKKLLRPQEVATRADVAAFVYQALVSQGELPPIASNSPAAQYIVVSSGGPTPPTPPSPPPTDRVPTATQAVLGLYGAWHEGRYDRALQYATSNVVNQLFAHPNNRYWEFRGCQSNKCTFDTARGNVTMQAQSLLGTQQQNFRVTSINFPSNPSPPVSASPEDAALGLVRAWRANNRSVAQQYAPADVVNEMFGLRSGTNLVFEGCQKNACLFSYPNGSIRLQTQRLLGTSTPNYRVTDLIIMNL